MTVANILPVNNHSGNGVNKKFDFDFPIENSSELVVTKINADGTRDVLICDLDYAIDIITDNENNFVSFGQSITFPISSSSHSILNEGEKISLALSLPVEQQKEMKNSNKLNLSTLEWCLDYLTRLIQILNRKTDRALKVQEGSNITTDILVSNLNTVADMSDKLSTVVNMNSVITSLCSNAENINSVASNLENINSVALDLDNINSASTYSNNANIWAEGSDAEVQALGGVHSAKVWAQESSSGQVQTDWSEIDTTSKAYIKNKPVKLSDFTNDLAPATVYEAGMVKPDGTSITVTSDGTISAQSSSRNIGEIVTSTTPLTDAGLHLLDGALLDGGSTYNITKVGTLTNIDGILSGFASALNGDASTNYAQIGTFTPDNYSWEMVAKVKITSSADIHDNWGAIYAGATDKYLQFSIKKINSEYKLHLDVGNGSSWYFTDLDSNSSLSLDTNYYVKVEYNNGYYRMYLSSDGNTWTQVAERSSSATVSCSLRLGIDRSLYNPLSNSEIDLRGCYIKINNNVTWQGVTEGGIYSDFVDYMAEVYDNTTSVWETYIQPTNPSGITSTNGFSNALNSFDNDSSTYASCGTTTDYIEWDLGETLKVSGFNATIQWVSGSAASCNISIYSVDDNNNETLIANGSGVPQGASGTSSAQFSMIEANKLRFKCIPNDGGQSLSTSTPGRVVQINIIAQREVKPIFCTENEWQASVTQYGVCGKFVYDSVNNTVRLPKITGFVEGTIDITALGNLVEAGLPNITGDVPGRQWDGGSGAFYKINNAAPAYYDNDDGGGNYGFDASLSNPIYGNSTTVQPQSIKVLYYIVLATSTKTDIQVDIDEIATDLNGKADIDLANTLPASTFIDKVSSWTMPDYTTGITRTWNTVYQAQDNVIVTWYVSGGGQNGQYAELYVGTTSNPDIKIDGGGNDQAGYYEGGWVIVPKGYYYKATGAGNYTRTLIEYPLKGAN